MNSKDQLADIFTEGLDPKQFEKNNYKLGMFDIYTPN